MKLRNRLGVIVFFLAFALLMIYSCHDEPSNQHLQVRQELSAIDSIKHQANYARILLHASYSKSSLISLQVSSKDSIAYLLDFIGNLNPDSSCSGAGGYNVFGEIDFYKDSAVDKLVSVHFLLKGKCQGLYVDLKGQVQRYFIKEHGLKFLSDLVTAKKDILLKSNRMAMGEVTLR